MVDALLGTVRVEAPAFRVDRLEPGPTVIPTGGRRALLALARGDLRLEGGTLGDTALGAGDALLTSGSAVVARAGDDGAAVLVATFDLHGAADRLLRLPDEVVAYADSELCRLLIERLTDEFDADPTSDVVSARLLDWLVADAVRDALVEAGPAAATTDPAVSAALAAVHADPALPWTVELLARRAGVGRAAFARRFRGVVGTSPLSYVREHRLDLAERALVTDPDATVAAVARRVGYANPFSFSTAFHRHRGRSPRDVRPPRPTAPAAR